MPILGAHMSIAGGYYKAVEQARDAGCDCVQVFTKNNNQWRAKPLTDQDTELFKAALQDSRVTHPLSHASYLINLASPDEQLRKKSVDAMVVELQRADALGIPYVVVHPGSYTTSNEATGLAAIVRSLDEIAAQTHELTTYPLLENTAGQGSNLGWKFEQLQAVFDGVANHARLGVCIDTCHAFAAGYEMGTQKKYNATMRRLSRTVGLRKIKAFHLNDSKKPLGSRRDRHDHIGQGEIGLDTFRLLLNDPRWNKTPMYLETPKGTEKGRDLDEINLEMLRSLMRDG